ncbi:hypothetical protein Godav_001735 [Gossypium davidsonii]|uniref:Uncharacterized protein n=1 Tax=Gossypium davidsonii TaxID=34287 RepID=A0A7J8T5Q5_GOSDV|nr:hypothetical protein [Gossypium davidsonii]
MRKFSIWPKRADPPLRVGSPRGSSQGKRRRFEPSSRHRLASTGAPIATETATVRRLRQKRRLGSTECVERRLAPRRAALGTSAGGAEVAAARAYSARVFCLILQLVISFPFAGTNIQTNEEVAIKLVSSLANKLAIK